MTKKRIWILAGLAAAVFAAVWYVNFRPVPLKADTYVQSTRPTIFFHGYGSTSNAEKHMANAAKKQGVTNTIIKADVAKDGKVTLKGTIPKDAINPIVLVNYDNNRDADYKKVSAYAYNVVKALQHKYAIKEMNMVGHSYGNMSIMFYMLYHGQDRSLPKLVKQVDIAGHFNGIIGYEEPKNVRLNSSDGKPSKMNDSYKRLLGVRSTYPKNQVDVLNIFGDTGKGSDERVSVVSSKSLRYLLNGLAKSYREELIKGPDGQHSKLHETSKVDDVLIPFLWGK